MSTSALHAWHYRHTRARSRSSPLPLPRPPPQSTLADCVAGIVVTEGDCFAEVAVNTTFKLLQLLGATHVPVTLSTLPPVNPFPAAWRAHGLSIDVLPLLNQQPQQVEALRRRQLQRAQAGQEWLAQALMAATEPATVVVTGACAAGVVRSARDLPPAPGSRCRTPQAPAPGCCRCCCGCTQGLSATWRTRSAPTHRWRPRLRACGGWAARCACQATRAAAARQSGTRSGTRLRLACSGAATCRSHSCPSTAPTRCRVCAQGLPASGGTHQHAPPSLTNTRAGLAVSTRTPATTLPPPPPLLRRLPQVPITPSFVRAFGPQSLSSLRSQLAGTLYAPAVEWVAAQAEPYYAWDVLTASCMLAQQAGERLCTVRMRVPRRLAHCGAAPGCVPCAARTQPHRCRLAAP